jgi:pimeloyl-ACP methyl ester carboxylesterase
MPDQTIEDVTLHYEVYGEGFPLLLLHGFTGTSKQWVPFVQRLELEYKLIVPDLPGHGRSAVPQSDFSHRKTAQYMYKLLDILNIENFGAIGFSSGGIVLLHMATQQPGRIKRMVLWSTSAFPTTQSRDRIAEIDPETITEKEWPWLGEHGGGSSQVKWILRQFRAFNDRYEDFDFKRPLLSSIEAVTLIIHGDRDEFHPATVAVALYEAVPNAFLWIFPNTFHMFPESAIPEIVQQSSSFLSGKWK